MFFLGFTGDITKQKVTGTVFRELMESVGAGHAVVRHVNGLSTNEPFLAGDFGMLFPKIRSVPNRIYNLYRTVYYLVGNEQFHEIKY